MTESGLVLHDALLTAVREVARGMWVLSLEAPEVAATARAGQFVNLGLEGFLLRRPFSVYRADGDRIEVVLKAVGVGTQRLLSMRPGDIVLTGGLTAAVPIGPGDLVEAVFGDGIATVRLPRIVRRWR